MDSTTISVQGFLVYMAAITESIQSKNCMKATFKWTKQKTQRESEKSQQKSNFAEVARDWKKRLSY